MNNVTQQMIDGAKDAGRVAWYKIPRSAAPALQAALSHLRANKDAMAEIGRCASPCADGLILYVGKSAWSKDIAAAAAPLAIEVG